MLRDESVDREPALGRGGDYRKIAQPFERQRQRARYGRCRERQNIDFGAQPLELLLLAHAEAMLFVDDDETQPRKLDVGLDQLVRADDEVDLAVGEALEHDLHLLGRTNARQLGQFYRQIGEAIGEDLEMLLRQQRPL